MSNLNIKLNKNNGKPLYKQLNEQITDLVRSRELPPGYRMPTERDLSLELGISRNTVSSAYKELEKQSILVSQQGKGTFVTEESILSLSRDKFQKLHRLMDMVLDEAYDQGVEKKEILEILEERISEKSALRRNTHSLFLECNIEQAKFFANELQESTGIPCDPLTITDLETMDSRTEEKVKEASVVIVTFNHVKEVSDLLKGYDKEIMGIAINPDLETIVRIARFPDRKKLGFLCISDQFMQKSKQALDSAGLGYLRIVFSNTRKEEEVRRIVEENEILIVSPGRRKDVEKYNGEKKEIIEFLFNLDEGSVKALKNKMAEKNLI